MPPPYCNSALGRLTFPCLPLLPTMLVRYFLELIFTDFEAQIHIRLNNQQLRPYVKPPSVILPPATFPK
jgi:hypothetical protein